MVNKGERWVIGPNGAGKTAAQGPVHTDAPDIRGGQPPRQILGAVDVFELRPRIRLASSKLAEQVPCEEVADLVVSAS